MSESDDRLPLEIGLIVAGQADSRTRQWVLAASRQLERELQRWFPCYVWRIETQVRRDIGEYKREESSELLLQAVEIRDTERQDFTLLITPDELIARYRPFALAALSRPLDAAVISTGRLIGKQDSDDEIVIDRLATLMLHSLAHIAGLSASPDREHLLHRPESPTDLDIMTLFDDDEVAALDAAFRDIADTRLEDTPRPTRSRWHFMLRAIAINREEIIDAVLAARPWEFPQRLSRLSTAAVSTLAILLMTAESWDLGLSQSWTTIVTLALAVLTLTTTFVVHRQQLLVSRHRQLREQLVVTRASALLIVIAGLATTWVGVFTLALLAVTTLFDDQLIVSWAASHELGVEAVNLATRLKMATFCASIGLLIGSLGASFENQQHFRHVIFVDEEL